MYSCLTCIPEAKTDPDKRAGICLACSYHCHEGHELIELYTKRNFRCDCGNSKFDSKQCNLCPDKITSNEENLYNQNFQGTYCVCSRPYPDPEDPVSDEMIQCIICEDWYHSRHLNTPVPSTPFVGELYLKIFKMWKLTILLYVLYLPILSFSIVHTVKNIEWNESHTLHNLHNIFLITSIYKKYYEKYFKDNYIFLFLPYGRFLPRVCFCFSSMNLVFQHLHIKFNQNEIMIHFSKIIFSFERFIKDTFF